MRGGEEILLWDTPCQNNMIYELTEFKKMCEGKRDFLHFLDVSSKVMITAEKIHSFE